MGSMNGALARTTVGRVLRASTTGFDCGTRGSRIEEAHGFGSFVKAPLDNSGALWAVGLIYGIRIEDDPLARELVMATGVDNSALLDQRENRMVPVEIGVINIGCLIDGKPYYSLPPRPPMSLTEVELCSDAEILRFTERLEFFRLVLNTREVPSDELLGAALQLASEKRASASERTQFLVECGRRLASLLSHDLTRLAHVLELIRP